MAVLTAKPNLRILMESIAHRRENVKGKRNKNTMATLAKDFYASSYRGEMGSVVPPGGE